ncbi:hypothetical protein Pse7367_3515 [Thalassoporum mexicanum PCC 7367]|uniref:DUF3226 domain-containing protein n=1 Tax=Thalassoporum mexicanum TaxID=3457544 RepID=UPI00029FB224|nr:DUF3226 domain-containing protein [Pseudanabaena sp. PCC 7367]AFY71750.1 hypothetical protein Pse7367_3515 [Pseudanabaena sp. PCC 7367]
MARPKQSDSNEPKILLVEGDNDARVIATLCKQSKLPKGFEIKIPESFKKNSIEASFEDLESAPKTRGVEILLEELESMPKTPDLKTLGVVVDADIDVSARWQSVKGRLTKVGYTNLPEDIPREGLIHEYIASSSDKFLAPRIGVWIMPDNQGMGMLEDFAKQMIPEDDYLLPKAEQILTEIEQDGLNKYTSAHRPKALIHTWLAWQRKPGMPMGQSITAGVLMHDSAIAASFVQWLIQLFELTVSEAIVQE